MTPWMEMALTVITSVLASGGLWTFLQAKFITKKEKNSATTVALQCLLRNEILLAERRFTKQGYCDPDDKTNIEHMFNAYSALGGNDVAHKAYLNIMELPSYRDDIERN